MLKKISAMDARRQFGQLMDEVSVRQDDYIVERAGKPIVAIIPVRQYEQLQKNKEQDAEQFFKWVDNLREKTKDVDPEILEQEIAEAVAAVKREELDEIKVRLTQQF
ncbi:type II toxin-antitoxin system Phd/YefM family antitoxin [Candidatus Magnetomonas plexicatena]|uniref:type II toxin-antitoxin system Phd/YefM family antitoxin n=1 Tax=Candidatus Magnetomonas plexicatena TaxID=2552947 RepID=UPI001C76E797|nr:type II toxin-antitoxin system Phd/YefM family antitoxin [Nitrospirales bacterium LBB_01]